MSNSIAKIFIVINFVLSIGYMFLAGTLLAHKWDYKQALEEKTRVFKQEQKNLQEEAKDYQARVANLSTLYQEASKSAVEYKTQYLTESEENKALKRKNAQFQDTLNSLQTDVQNINDKLGRKEERIAQLEKERDEAKERSENHREARESAEDSLQAMKIRFENLEAELVEKTNMLQKTQRELLEAKQLIRVANSRGFNFASLVKSTPKALDGVIVATASTSPIVMISIGSDNGVAVGDKFTVYRGDKYIGRVVVEKVDRDRSIASISQDMTVGQIRKGDKVSTRIGRGS